MYGAAATEYQYGAVADERTDTNTHEYSVAELEAAAAYIEKKGKDRKGKDHDSQTQQADVPSNHWAPRSPDAERRAVNDGVDDSARAAQSGAAHPAAAAESSSRSGRAARRGSEHVPSKTGGATPSGGERGQWHVDPDFDCWRRELVSGRLATAQPAAP